MSALGHITTELSGAYADVQAWYFISHVASSEVLRATLYSHSLAMYSIPVSFRKSSDAFTRCKCNRAR